MLETLFGAVTEAVFGYLLEQSGTGERVRDWLKRNPARLAFRVALAQAYAALNRAHPEWTAALFDEPFLAGPAAPLLAQCLSRAGTPDPTALATAWAAQLGHPKNTRARLIQEATPPTATFLEALEGALRSRTELQTLFDSRALDTSAQASAESAAHLAALRQELSAALATLPASLAETNAALREALTDLRATVERITKGTPTEPDLTALRFALRAELIQLPRPGGSAAVSGNVSHSVLIVGHGNVVIYASDAETLRQAVQGQLPTARPSPRLADCPFVAGPTVPPDHFHGRTHELASLRLRLGAVTPGSVSLVGTRRSGKSSLLRLIRERPHTVCPPEHQPLVVTLDFQELRYHTPTGLLEGLRRTIARESGQPPWQPHEANDPWAVTDGLERLRDSGRRLIVLLDEFELLGQHLPAFQGWGGDWRAKANNGLFTLVVASLHPLESVYQACGLESPFGNIFGQVTVGAFTEEESRTLMLARFASTGDLVSETELALIDQLAGSLPYYVQLAGMLLWQHRDPATVRTEFVLQVAPRFRELWNNLTPTQQATLRRATPDPALQRLGLLRPDGQPFCRPFAEFVRAQR